MPHIYTNTNTNTINLMKQLTPESDIFHLVVTDTGSQIIKGTQAAQALFNTPAGRSMSVGHPSEAALRSAIGIPDEPCRECGCVFSTDYVEERKKLLLLHNICFYCSHWLEMFQRREDPEVARVGGGHYIVHDYVPSYKGPLGHGGSIFNVLWHDGRAKRSNNVWFQGTIPKHWQERLPNNAQFVP